jgi:hypothetical protein
MTRLDERQSHTDPGDPADRWKPDTWKLSRIIPQEDNS